MANLVYDRVGWGSLGDVTVVTAVHERCYVRLERIRREWSQVKGLARAPGCERRFRIGNLILLFHFRDERSVQE